jgi:hypothetical protein
MKNLIFLLKLSFIILFFTKCAVSVPFYDIKTTPLLPEEIIYQNGIPFLIKEKDNIVVNISPEMENNQKEYISFIVQIKNNSTETILFDPTNSKINLTNQKQQIKIFSAYNPEFMISHYNKIVAMNEREHQQNQKSLASSQSMQGTTQMLNGATISN